MKDVFPMKVITHTVTHQRKKTDIDTHSIMYQANFAGGHIESKMYPANFAGGQIESKMYPAKFAGGRSRLDLLLPSFLPSREEKKKQERIKQSIDSGAEWHNLHMDRVRIEMKKQDRIFCPLRGHAVGRMQYAPTTCRQESMFQIILLARKDETKIQDRIFCPLRGHSVWRMLLRPTTCRQETLFPINSRKERKETKMQEQKKRPLGSRGVLHTPYMDRVRIETKKQDRIFCPLRGHSVGRMRYAPITCRQESMFQIILLAGREKKKMQDQKNRPLGSRGVLHTPHTDRVRTETKMQERRKQSIDSGAEWHTPFMRQGERDAVWRDTFLEQRARVAIWRDRRLEEKYSHARFQLSTFGENSKPYKSSLVALSEQLRDIFAA